MSSHFSFTFLRNWVIVRFGLFKSFPSLQSLFLLMPYHTELLRTPRARRGTPTDLNYFWGLRYGSEGWISHPNGNPTSTALEWVQSLSSCALTYPNAAILLFSLLRCNAAISPAWHNILCSNKYATTANFHCAVVELWWWWWCFSAIASWEVTLGAGSPATASLIRWWVACWARTNRSMHQLCCMCLTVLVHLEKILSSGKDNIG